MNELSEKDLELITSDFKKQSGEAEVLEIKKMRFLAKLSNTAIPICTWLALFALTRVGETWADRVLFAYFMIGMVLTAFMAVIITIANVANYEKGRKDQIEWLKTLARLTGTSNTTYFPIYSVVFIVPIIFTYLFAIGYTWTSLLYGAMVGVSCFFRILTYGFESSLKEKLNVEIKIVK